MKQRPVLNIIAPSGAMENNTLLPLATQRLNYLGFNTRLDSRTQLIHQRFAGIDVERANSLKESFLDPSVNIIMAARGGYGAHRLLPLLDWNLLADAVHLSNKQVVGHSDFTAISMALLAHGACSIAGPCAGVDFGGDTVNAVMADTFKSLMEFKLNTKLYNNFNKHNPSFKLSFNSHLIYNINNPIALKGRLWGGNLAMLCSLLGTPYFPSLKQIDGGILFIEDVNERPFRIERMLNQLYLAGVLTRQTAILLGDFGNPAIAEYDRGYDLNAVFKYISDLKGLESTPIITGLPFGHCPEKWSLPVGSTVSLNIHQANDNACYNVDIVL